MEQARLQDLVKIMCKLLLSNSLQVRALRAIMIECIKVRTQSPWVVAHKNGTTAYEKLQKEQKELGIVMEKFKEISGIPSVHGFNQMCLRLVELLKESLAAAETTKDQDQTHMNTFLAAEAKLKSVQQGISQWPVLGGWKYVHRHIPHCKVAKMYNANDQKLEIAAPFSVPTEEDMASKAPALPLVTPTVAWILIKDLIFQEGGKEMMGMAPAGDLERKVQEFLDVQGQNMQQD